MQSARRGRSKYFGFTFTFMNKADTKASQSRISCKCHRFPLYGGPEGQLHSHFMTNTWSTKNISLSAKQMEQNKIRYISKISHKTQNYYYCGVFFKFNNALCISFNQNVFLFLKIFYFVMFQLFCLRKFCCILNFFV